MRSSQQEHWNGLPFPSPGDLPNPGIKPRSPPTLQANSLPSESHQGSPLVGPRKSNQTRHFLQIQGTTHIYAVSGLPLYHLSQDQRAQSMLPSPVKTSTSQASGWQVANSLVKHCYLSEVLLHTPEYVRKLTVLPPPSVSSKCTERNTRQNLAITLSTICQSLFTICHSLSQRSMNCTTKKLNWPKSSSPYLLSCGTSSEKLSTDEWVKRQATTRGEWITKTGRTRQPSPPPELSSETQELYLPEKDRLPDRSLHGNSFQSLAKLPFLNPPPLLGDLLHSKMVIIGLGKQQGKLRRAMVHNYPRTTL